MAIQYLQTQQQQAIEYKLKTALVLGGWNTQEILNSIINSPTATQNFIDNIAGTLDQLYFNRVNIKLDLTSSSQLVSADKLADFFSQLAAKIGENRISVGLPGTTYAFSKIPGSAWAKIAASVGAAPIATNFNGAWSSISDNQTPVYTDPQNPTYPNSNNVVDTFSLYQSVGLVKVNLG